MEEIAACNDDDELLNEIVEKLSFFFSDRAANEKAANRLLETWRDEQLEKASSQEKKQTIHNFYCMAHALLGFHSYGTKELEAIQKELQNGGTLLGRDKSGAYCRFGKEKVCGHVPRMVSEIVGPVGDEKNGIQDKWAAFCVSKNIKSQIQAYKDNRFNAMFMNSMQTIHHQKHLVELIRTIEEKVKGKLNLKVKSVLLDLEDHNVCAILHAVAMVGAKLTVPYWDLVTSGEVQYLELYKPIQAMYNHVRQWLENTDKLLDPAEPPVFQAFPANTDAVYESVFTVAENLDIGLLKKSACALLQGIKKCCEKQLADFLPEGKYGTQPSQEDLKNTANSHTTNLSCERHFGSLDASQHRRRNASMHYHSSVLMLKAHGTKLLNFLSSHPKRKELWLRARKQGKTLRQAHKEHEASQMKILQEDLLKPQLKSVNKKIAAKIVKKAKVTTKQTGKRKAEQNISQAKPKKSKVSETESGSSNNHVQSVVVPSVTSACVNDWVAVGYENGWYPGKILSIQSDNDNEKTHTIDFLHPTNREGIFKDPPGRADVSTVPREFIFVKFNVPPISVSRGRRYELVEYESACDLYQVYKNHNQW